MEDERSKPLDQNPPETSTGARPAPPRRAATVPSLHPALAFIVKILDHWILSLIYNVSLGILTFDSLVAAYRSRSSPWTIAFVVVAYGALMLFFWFVSGFEAATEERKRRLMVPISTLAMFLIGLFSYRVASMMPYGFAIAVWAVTGLSFVAGFYVIFIFGRGFNAGNGKAEGEKSTGKTQRS